MTANGALHRRPSQGVPGAGGARAQRGSVAMVSAGEGEGGRDGDRDGEGVEVGQARRRGLFCCCAFAVSHFSRLARHCSTTIQQARSRNSQNVRAGSARKRTSTRTSVARWVPEQGLRNIVCWFVGNQGARALWAATALRAATRSIGRNGAAIWPSSSEQGNLVPQRAPECHCHCLGLRDVRV